MFLHHETVATRHFFARVGGLLRDGCSGELAEGDGALFDPDAGTTERGLSGFGP